MGKKSAVTPLSSYIGSNHDEVDVNILSCKRFGLEEKFLYIEFIVIILSPNNILK
jgi:hypothetical protein